MWPALLALPGSAALWQKIWLGRHQIRSGIVRQLHSVCSFFQITWARPCEFRCGDCCVSFGARGVDKHLCRELLRCAAWRLAAADRRKDFAGCEDGVFRSAQVARMLGQACGPSLLTGGQWTAGKLF